MRVRLGYVAFSFLLDRGGSKVIEQAADAVERCFDVGREKRDVLGSEICWG